MEPLADFPEFLLDAAWITWLKENIKLGVSKEALVATLVARGCEPREAEVLVGFTTIEANLSKEGERLEKARWLLNSLRTMQSQTGSAYCAERTKVDAAEFFEVFYSHNRPVVYRQAVSQEELTDRLDWKRLERDFGEIEVEVQEGRSERDDYERSSNELKSRARFADFLQRTQTAVESNDFYMTANNSSANVTLIEAAIQPELVCPELLDGSKAHGHIFLWIGPSGTFTPAHHDLTNNLFLQVHGSKEFRLASSLALLDLDNDRHCYLASSLSDTDRRRLAAGLEPISFTVSLEAGDVLFIPLGWWHEVRGLSPSISLSATNFRARNNFHRSYSFYGPIAG